MPRNPSTLSKGLIFNPVAQTEDMLKDYVSKIQKLETELHQYRSLQTNPRSSKPSLLTSTAGFGDNCTVTDFAADILPSSKNSCYFDVESLPLDCLLLEFLRYFCLSNCSLSKKTIFGIEIVGEKRMHINPSKYEHGHPRASN